MFKCEQSELFYDKNVHYKNYNYFTLFFLFYPLFRKFLIKRRHYEDYLTNTIKTTMSSFSTTSVADPDPNPDPDPQDPHVFGPPGSGATGQRYGSGSTGQRYGSGSGSCSRWGSGFFYHAKLVKKP
jgi:hypothetical protein